MADDDTTYKVALGPVTQAKIPPGDPRWPSFNASFTNHELPAAIIAAHLYDGRPITTWHKNHWRTGANYVCGQHLGIDFDTEDKRSTLTTLLHDPFISRYGSFVYTTPSHTPDKPRSRAMFLLDTPLGRADNYTLAASALLWVFGSADRQCKDAVRFFYGGRPGACEMEFIGNVLTLEVLRDLVRRYRETGRVQRRRMEIGAYNAPDQQKVADALRFIDAWAIDYDQWVSILMAIHSAFPGDDGLGLAESWAQGKNGEVEQKWRSFHDTGNASGKVGVGTLFALAKERGWQLHA
jgi:hypothetical protein